MTKHPMSRDVRGKKNPRWRPAMERFWEKVKKTDDCWLWMASKNNQGYGSFKVDGVAVLAHRFITDAPDDKCVLHTCDNPSCVNPDHLYFGDRKQNAFDRDSRGRNGFQRLKDEEIVEIYESGLPVADLAKIYNKCHAVISRIKRGESYKWLLDKSHT